MSENHASERVIARRVGYFLLLDAKNFLPSNFKAMFGDGAAFAGPRRLTRRSFCRISHAHAGLAKLRPPPPSALFAFDHGHRSAVAPGRSCVAK